MRAIRTIPLLLAACAAPAVAQPAVTVPGFVDLERWHARDRTDALARQRIAANIPVGGSLAAAVRGIEAVGGECRADRRRPGTQACLIHQMSMANRAFDDIRWTISLGSDGDRLTSVAARRTVDRHLTT